jgi:hypothetical protein
MHAARVVRALHMGKRAINRGVERGRTPNIGRKECMQRAGNRRRQAWDGSMEHGSGYGAELGRVPAGWLRIGVRCCCM